jgi:hypothetical protein
MENLKPSITHVLINDLLFYNISKKALKLYFIAAQLYVATLMKTPRNEYKTNSKNTLWQSWHW